MANLSREQEAINREHIRHQVQDHVSRDPKCAECRRIPMKEKLDRDREWDNYARLNGLKTTKELEGESKS